MNFPNRETVEKLRREYPVGCRIVLDAMDDPYVHIPVGSQATVTGVDDAGVMCVWDMGSSLSIAYGADLCHKIVTEEESKITLDWYGQHQPDTDARCPRCGKIMWGPRVRYALSRWANITVCDSCGTAEALEKAKLIERKPLTEWCAIKLPAIGGGKWRR